MPGDIEQSDGLSDLFFSFAVAIDFGGVKEVDSIVPCSFDTVDGVLFGFLGVGVEPVAKGDDGDLDAGGAEVAILHCH